MAKPNIESFLAAVFKPSANPPPKGLRKTAVKATKGRNRRRVTAYNRLSPLQQEILRYSGKRDAYLKGDVTLAEVQRELRPEAVRRGVVKPQRYSRRQRAVETVERLARQRPASRDSRKINPKAIRENVRDASDDAINRILGMSDYHDLYDAATDPDDEDNVFDDSLGRVVDSVYWYH